MSALTPFPPQEDCIHDMVDAITRHGYVINKSCTGTGKTLVTMNREGYGQEASRRLPCHRSDPMEASD